MVAQSLRCDPASDKLQINFIEGLSFTTLRLSNPLDTKSEPLARQPRVCPKVQRL